MYTTPNPAEKTAANNATLTATLLMAAIYITIGEFPILVKMASAAKRAKKTLTFVTGNPNKLKEVMLFFVRFMYNFNFIVIPSAGKGDSGRLAPLQPHVASCRA